MRRSCREMYSDYGICVSLMCMFLRRGIPTLFHVFQYNFGEWLGVLSSYAPWNSFKTCAWVVLLWQQTLTWARNVRECLYLLYCWLISCGQYQSIYMYNMSQYSDYAPKLTHLKFQMAQYRVTWLAPFWDLAWNWAKMCCVSIAALDNVINKQTECWFWVAAILLDVRERYCNNFSGVNVFSGSLGT